MATTGTNLFQEVNKLPEKVQVNVGTKEMILAAIILIAGMTMLVTAQPTEPGFFASSTAQFYAILIFLPASLLGLIGIPFRWRTNKFAALAPPVASAMVVFMFLLVSSLPRSSGRRPSAGSPENRFSYESQWNLAPTTGQSATGHLSNQEITITFQQHGGQISFEGAPSAPPNESSP